MAVVGTAVVVSARVVIGNVGTVVLTGEVGGCVGGCVGGTVGVV